MKKRVGSASLRAAVGVFRLPASFLEAGRRSLDSGNKAIRIIYPSATSIEPSALE